MSLAERGLLYTMRLECWENQSVPLLSNGLAKYLGFNHQDVSTALSTNVITYFNDSGGSYVCPELEDYRQHLNEQKQKKSAGGKKGAAITNKKWGEIGSSNPQVTRESLVHLSSEQLSSEQFLESDYIDDDFVKEYERVSR